MRNKLITFTLATSVFIALNTPWSYSSGLTDKLKEALEERFDKEIDKALNDEKEEKAVDVQLEFEQALESSSETLSDSNNSNGSSSERPRVTVVRPAPAVLNNVEEQCYNLVQGKIAWNTANNKSWSPNNVKRLCAGTKSAAAPGACFNYILLKGHDWGKTNAHNVAWPQALATCAGTNHAGATTNCFKASIKSNKSVDTAIRNCASNNSVKTASHTTPRQTANTIIKQQEKECYDYIQGKIAWDNAGKNKSWSPANVKRLCKGTHSKYSPGKCFQYVMFEGSDWGKRAGDKISWGKAIELCEGTSNNRTTTSCFKNAIAAGRSIQDAIKQCK